MTTYHHLKASSRIYNTNEQNSRTSVVSSRCFPSPQASCKPVEIIVYESDVYKLMWHEYTRSLRLLIIIID